jgi:hypothetical protein
LSLEPLVSSTSTMPAGLVAAWALLNNLSYKIQKLL